MTVIRKKTWPEYFEAVQSGKKNFDLRLNDVDVKDGDTLVLEEWDPKTKAYTGRKIEKTVTYAGKFKLDDLFWPKEEIMENGIQILGLNMDALRPKVGVGVFILKDGKILLGKRKNAHGEGEYAPPGGHFEYMESLVECAKREVMEETGMEIENVRFLCLSNLKAYAPKHSVNVGFLADWKSGEPEVKEPEKCETWDWYDPSDVPSPTFATMPLYLEALKNGPNFFDT